MWFWHWLKGTSQLAFRYDKKLSVSCNVTGFFVSVGSSSVGDTCTPKS